jgi:hypothetical protein
MILSVAIFCLKRVFLNVMNRFYNNFGYILGCCLALAALNSFGQSGIISTKRSAPYGVVTFSGNAALTGISNTKHIDGYVKKAGTTKFAFPVGDNGVYRPFAASGDATTGAYFLENANGVTIPAGGPFLVANKENTLDKVSAKEFWDIDGTNATAVTLTWNAASDITGLTGSALSRLTIVGWNAAASRWEKIISTPDATALLGGASTLTAGSITTSSTLVPNTYNIYTLGATISGPLPVTLISFKAVADDAGQAKLNWSTTYESNSEVFNVEHSSDGKDWTLKGKVESVGESSVLVNYNFTDVTPVAGENLYRLKMIDKDGTYAYSRIESVQIGEKTVITFFPNPVSEKLFIMIQDVNAVKEVNLHSVNGDKIYSSSLVTGGGIDVSRYNPGIYLVQVILKNGTYSRQKIVITK